MFKNNSLNHERPVVLSVAGFDPSGGAGVLADIKVFDYLKTYGQAVITTNTLQHDQKFTQCTDIFEFAMKQIELLSERSFYKAIKVGLLADFEQLIPLVSLLHSKYPQSPVVWDPIFQPSFGERKIEFSIDNLAHLPLEKLALFTPNQDELNHLTNNKKNNIEEIHSLAVELSKGCPLLLKGGHSSSPKYSTDILFYWENDTFKQYEFKSVRLEGAFANKRGTGCVLSAAITAYLAHGYSLIEAIEKAKNLINQYLKSSTTRLGILEAHPQLF
jgi:hydroxymethylpyrimidine/phosphomethylpyrimidine kinase